MAKTARTACEEAAAFLSDDYDIVGISNRKKMIANPEARNELAKRLRAEGRKIRRYERLIVKYVQARTVSKANVIYEHLEREAARIQKEKKK